MTFCTNCGGLFGGIDPKNCTFCDSPDLTRTVYNVPKKILCCNPSGCWERVWNCYTLEEMSAAHENHAPAILTTTGTTSFTADSSNIVYSMGPAEPYFPYAFGGTQTDRISSGLRDATTGSPLGLTGRIINLNSQSAWRTIESNIMPRFSGIGGQDQSLADSPRAP